MRTALVAAGLVLAAPAAALAANANHPYSNIDHRVDAGNNTGDAQVDQLNQAQLSQPGQPPSYASGVPPQSYSGSVRSRQATAAPRYAASYPPPVAGPYPVYAAPAYAPPPYAYAYPPPAYVVLPRPFVRPYLYPYY
jgi:hypothetical protein